MCADWVARTYHWAGAEQRRAGGKVQRRHSQGLLAEVGLIHMGAAWAKLLDKLGCPSVPSGEGWGHKCGRAPGEPPRFFPSEKLNPS